MLSSRMLVSSAVRACQPQFNIWQRLQRFSGSAVYGVEDFIDREFTKAREDLDIDALDNPKSLLQKLERDQKRRIKATKAARTARLFQTQNDPRTLARDTMEQIRYLKQEHGDEWTVKRLAHSFDVTEAVIVKVLKSKFAPSEQRRRKQDTKVKINTGLLPEATASTTREMVDHKTLLTAFSKASPANILAPVDKRQISDDETSQEKPFSSSRRETVRHQKMPDQRSSKLTKEEDPVICQTKPISEVVKVRQHVAVDSWSGNSGKPVQSFMQPSATSSNATFRKGQEVSQQSREPNQFHRERVLEPDGGGTQEEELTFDMENLDSYDDGTPPPQVLRKGNEFFDEKGEFLFRV